MRVLFPIKYQKDIYTQYMAFIIPLSKVVWNLISGFTIGKEHFFLINTLSFHLKTYHTLWDPGLPSSGDDWGSASWWACGPLEFGDPHVRVPGWKASLWGRDKHRYLQKNNKSWFAFPSLCIWRGQGSYIKSKWNSYGNFYLNIFYDQKSPCKTCCRGCTSLPT